MPALSITEAVITALATVVCAWITASIAALTQRVEKLEEWKDEQPHRRRKSSGS